MDLLRPSRRLIDVHGYEWELYVSRVGPRRRSLARGFLVSLGLDKTQHDVYVTEPLQIKAVTVLPHPETYLWTTTTDHLPRVIEQIAAELTAGDLARPLGAAFVGRESNVADRPPARRSQKNMSELR